MPPGLALRRRAPLLPPARALVPAAVLWFWTWSPCELVSALPAVSPALRLRLNRRCVPAPSCTLVFICSHQHR